MQPAVRQLILGALLLLTLVPPALPAQSDEIESVRRSLVVLLPDIVPDSVRSSVIPGLYEVVVGSRLVYVTADGRYLIEGEITDLEQRKNLTLPRLNEVTLGSIEAVGEALMLVFEPSGEVRHTISVFTDIDSAFSRKLHRELPHYANLGIRVRYLFFPRAGRNSPSYHKAVSVWCAEDRKQRLESAMSGRSVPEGGCVHPVDAHLQLAEKLGISGAPVLVLDNGELLPGYVSAQRLSDVLNRKRSQSRP